MRLYSIWRIQEDALEVRKSGNKAIFSLSDEQKQSFISTTGLIKWLLILLAPFFILSFVMVFVNELVVVFSFFAMPECGGVHFREDF